MLSLPAAADDINALKAELKRLTERLEAIEQRNRKLEQSLASERINANKPERTTQAVESQTLAMQKTRQIEALRDISVKASLTGVLQGVNGTGSSTGSSENRANYRGDISVALPGGKTGDIEGNIFAHLRVGQGRGLSLRPTYTSTPNTTAFEVGSTPADDSFAILAQAWYQLKVPLPRGGVKAEAREHVDLTFGKIDPFGFFDQNSIADDESVAFMNNAFVHNPLLDSGGDVGADAYGFAPGAIARYRNAQQQGPEWGVSLGVFGSGKGANFTSSPLTRPFIIAQADVATRINFLPGNYRAYLWTNGRGADYNGNASRHTGIGFSIDQQVGDDLTLFARYGHQLKGKVRFDCALTVGAELSGNTWGRGADALGVAFGGLRTAADFRNDSPGVDADGDGNPDFGYQANGWEKQAELYYRYKLNDNFELTPDFQLISRPGGDSSASTVKLLAVRARIGF